MSSADLSTDTSPVIDGLPAYQQSIQNFVKRQLSNTTAAALDEEEADKDVIEIDLDEERNDILYDHDLTSHHYQSPVYPALFLNDIIGNEQQQEDDDCCYFYGCTSAYESEEALDYFSLCRDSQGIIYNKQIYLYTCITF